MTTERERTGGADQRDRVGAEIRRFLVAGFLNMAFGFAVYAIAVLAGVNVAVALLLATFAGVFFNFVTFGGYAFRQLELRRLPAFLASYAFLYALNLALLHVVRTGLKMGAIDGQLACLVVVAPTAYLLLRSKVFARR